MQFTEKSFDFNTLVEEIIKEMQLTSKRSPIEKLLDRSVTVYGDRNRIGQVITNLLSNATKYSPKADHMIATTIYTKNEIKFSVQGYGVGIKAENLAHVFDQFFRVSGFIQDIFAGLGLGLFIASEIIKRHQGVISVESKEGLGSTFSFTLPLGNNTNEI